MVYKIYCMLDVYGGSKQAKLEVKTENGELCFGSEVKHESGHIWTKVFYVNHILLQIANKFEFSEQYVNATKKVDE